MDACLARGKEEKDGGHVVQKVQLKSHRALVSCRRDLTRLVVPDAEI